MKNPKTLQALPGCWFLLNKLHYKKLKKRIKQNEGFSNKVYKDQLGFLTIGYGHLILPNEHHLINNKHNKEQLEKIFIRDFKKALRDYNKFLKKKTYKRKDEELLIEMVFQMGVRKVLMFKNLLSNIKKNNHHLVCFEMMNSLWYTQTPNRVKKLITTYLCNE